MIQNNSTFFIIIQGKYKALSDIVIVLAARSGESAVCYFAPIF